MRVNIGDLGEDIFQQWCTAAGMVAQKSQRDRYGWDYLVEMAVARDSGRASDLHKANGVFKVQVKSTCGTAKSKQVELSNLLLLATDPLPSFYLFLHFDSSSRGELSAAYLICLDQSWIKKILHRVREVTASKTNARLNKSKLSITYAEQDLIKPANAEAFLDKILGMVGGDFSTFTKEKRDYLDTVGYEEGGAEVSVVFETKEQQEKFILSTLGYRQPLNFSSFRVWEKRFGIRDIEPFIDSSKGTLELKVSDQRMVRVMLTPPGADPMFFDMKLYVSGIPGNNRLLPFRLSGKFFDILINVAKQTTQFTPEVKDDETYPVEEFQAAIRFMNLLFSSGKSVALAVEHDNEFLPMFSLNCSLADTPFPWEEQTLDDLRSVLAACSSGQVKISRRWLYQNNVFLRQAAQMLSGRMVLKVANVGNELTDFSDVKCAFAIEFLFADQRSILFF